MGNRINRSVILKNVADRTGFALHDVKTMYDVFVDEVISNAVAGDTVVLNGFGTFYLQAHKGHPIRFESCNHRGAIDDYLVFKFSASHSMNDKLRRLSAQMMENRG